MEDTTAEPGVSAGGGEPGVGVDAIVDHLEELLKVVAASHSFRRTRLRESVDACSGLGRRIVSLGLIMGATADLDREQIRPFLDRLPKVLGDEVYESLDLVSETLLMVSDKDLQASGAIAASMLVQRSLPDGVVGRDLVLQALVELLGLHYQDRMTRHSDVFAPLRQVEQVASLRDLPALLSDISEALEDIACERDVFLDNPIELVAKERPPEKSSDESFKRSRMQGGADLPPLSEELKQLALLEEAVGWSHEQALTLATELYDRGAMDRRAKIGLSFAAIVGLVSELNEALDQKVSEVVVNHGASGSSAPYAYDEETGSLTLNTRYRGTLTTRILKAEHPAILEDLKQSEEEREEAARQAEAERQAALLAKAKEDYAQARVAAHGILQAEDEELVAVQALAGDLGLTEIQSYELMARLYAGEDRVTFSREENQGITVQGLRDYMEIALDSENVSDIVVDPKADARFPASFDREAGVLKLHSAFRGLSNVTLKWSTEEWTREPMELAGPDAGVVDEYELVDQPGGLLSERNMDRFIDEFKLAGEFAKDSFAVLEDCPGFLNAISMKALRVVVATINARLDGDKKIDLVTGWSREIPGTTRPDHVSVAWLSTHVEEGEEPLEMLTFNMEYGSGGRELSPYSDDLILEWCRHYPVRTSS